MSNTSALSYQFAIEFRWPARFWRRAKTSSILMAAASQPRGWPSGRPVPWLLRGGGGGGGGGWGATAAKVAYLHRGQRPAVMLPHRAGE